LEGRSSNKIRIYGHILKMNEAEKPEGSELYSKRRQQDQYGNERLENISQRKERRICEENEDLQDRGQDQLLRDPHSIPCTTLINRLRAD
jgi:hypothetical protein